MASDAAVALRSALAILFLFAAVAKVLSRSSPAQFLEELGLAPVLSRWITRCLAPGEALIGLFLLLGVAGVIASLFAACASLMFLVVTLAARVKRSTQACNCFGELDSHSSKRVVEIRAIALVGAAFALVGIEILLLQGPAAPFGGKSMGAALIGAVAAMGIVMVSTMASQVQMLSAIRGELSAARR